MSAASVDRWRHRRAMAWLALVSGLLYPLLALAVQSSAVMASLSGPFYLFVGAVVGAYVGFATVDDRWQRNYHAERDYPREAMQ